MIQFVDIEKIFYGKAGDVHALHNVNLTVEEGDIFGVIGFSGAGKSTLIRLVNGLEKATSGKVIVNGQEIGLLSKPKLRAVRKEIGMVFQQFNLLDSKTVYDNVAIPLVLNKVPKDQIKKRVLELLDFVELSDKVYTYPSKLSGGQKQRVGIARALATNPRILLCDEATSALDPKTTASILELLKKINQKIHITILIITHEMNVIRELCNKVAVMENGQIVEQGSVLNVFGSPKNEVTKDFVKTVINDTIPESIAKDLKEHITNSTVLKLKFIGNYTKDSILSKINKKFDVSTNIIFVTVNELKEDVLGIIIVEIVGEEDERNRVIAYLESIGVDYERVML